MLFHDPAADGEAQAGSLAIAAEAGFEDPVLYLGSDTASVVRKLNRGPRARLPAHTVARICSLPPAAV